MAIAAMTAVMVPFTACDDDSDLGPKDKADYESNFVYLETPASTFAEVEYKANGDFMSGLTDPLKLVPVRLTKPAPRDLQVEIVIDPSLVAEYNAAKGTDYKFLTGAKIDNPVMNIAEGAYISSDTISISFGDHSGFIDQEKDLILPIVVNGGDGLTPSKSGRIFLTFTSTYRPNYLSIPAETKTFKAVTVVEGWEETIKTIEISNAFKLTYAPFEDVKVNIAIDESKVAEFNEANGTDYVFKNDATLASNTLTIGTDATNASFSINTGDPTGLANDITYVIPVTVTSIEGAAVELEEGNTVYVVVKGVSREMSVSRSEYTGSLLPYPVACTVGGKTTGYYGYNWVDVINNGKWQYDYLYSNSLMEIDFGQVVKLSSFYVYHWSSSYSADKLKMETSADGIKWSDWGEVSYQKASSYYVNMSTSEDVRYMRLVFSNTNNGYIEFDGMQFYGN